MSYFRDIHGIAALRIPALPPVAWSANCYPESSSCQDWGNSGAFSAATAGPPLNLGRGPGVAYDLSGRSLLDKSGQVLNTTEQILALPATTQDRLTLPRVARLTLSLAMLPFAESKACGQLASGFCSRKNKSKVSSTTRTATTCCSSNTSTLPRKLSKVEIHASPRLLLVL